jgi:2-C-methyl-D-erythritol 4-phosphate cytidylyltransferase/2-C-methyl-D-erythritol 2,4-cyclodiphosphate synthase
MTAARRVWAVVPAAGRGERFTSTSALKVSAKQYAPLAGATVIEWSLRALLAEPRVHGVVVVLAADDGTWPAIAARLNNPKLQTAIGGVNRQASVLNGLEYLNGQAAPDDWVMVHDAARPCFTASDLRALLDALDGAGVEPHATGAAAGAVLAAPVVDTVKRELGGDVATVDRRGLWRALTPQAFAFAQLRHALSEATLAGIEVTDDAQAIERMGLRPALVAGSPFNIKVTRAEDLALAERILKMNESDGPVSVQSKGQGEGDGESESEDKDRREGGAMRVGQGFDVHAFGEGNHVVLGGVRLAHSKGVVAHSDGDVVIHALCDAILGALGDGDIGRHFPDSDPKYRGADSRVFLRVVAERMHAAGFQLVNADVTVLAEAPRIAAHRAAMAGNLAADLGVAAQLVNVKATTTERLGFIGRGEGLAAMATVLLAR